MKMVVEVEAVMVYLTESVCVGVEMVGWRECSSVNCVVGAADSEKAM